MKPNDTFLRVFAYTITKLWFNGRLHRNRANSTGTKTSCQSALGVTYIIDEKKSFTGHILFDFPEEEIIFDIATYINILAFYI